MASKKGIHRNTFRGVGPVMKDGIGQNCELTSRCLLQTGAVTILNKRCNSTRTKMYKKCQKITKM